MLCIIHDRLYLDLSRAYFFFFEVKGRSTARSYKKKENVSTYKGCDYINKKVTQSLRN